TAVSGGGKTGHSAQKQHQDCLNNALFHNVICYLSAFLKFYKDNIKCCCKCIRYLIIFAKKSVGTN
ncbi:MAG: hypothetical protein IIU04_05405, partial [Bacteroidales bacterium]|nr:hypothetical protein [Bacteroidales bacterium]